MTQLIRGVVSPSLEIVISIRVGGPTGRNREISALVDTGFVVFLALPQSVAEELSFPYIDDEPMTMADGRVERIDRHWAGVIWDGEPRAVQAHVVDSEPALIGVRLLSGYNLNADFVEGGQVTIRPVGQSS